MRYVLMITLLVCVTLGFSQDDAVFFSDSQDSTFYDPSWGFTNGDSYVELVGAGNDKFPVDTEHPYKGAHSLRLHWISESGGDWGIAVAGIGWPGHDLTQYDSLVYWINAPEAIAQADLPDLALEDKVDNNKSTRAALGDYFSGVDSDSTSWQRVVIPINAFSPGPDSCDFTRIKTIFHFQRNADGVEHIAWLDEIRAVKIGAVGPGLPDVPQNITAGGHDSRIDLKWDANTDTNTVGYFVYRSSILEGTYSKLNPTLHETHLYSDFFGQNDQTYYYYVTASNQSYEESAPSDTVSATSYAMTEEELLSSVQEAMFRYFYDYAHPVSGLILERKSSDNTCATGGTGFGLMTLMIGAERRFISRDSAATRVLKILTFLQEEADTYHGAWAHWINGATGETIPFSQYDDGGDIVETAYLIQGVLTIRQYFDQDNAVENEIRTRATQMWEGVEWDWYRNLQNTDGSKIFWHWSPNHAWAMNFPITGFNEAMIVYLLAIASPTHPVPASLYYDGWASPSNYANGDTFYGYEQWVGPDYGGPLFFTHYSYLGFDPRFKSDNFCNYFENNRNISLIHREYCIENPNGFTGYDSLVWGLTASDQPGGYSAHAPHGIGGVDNGTITPTAAISAMPYVPEESMATLKHFYYELGPQLWGEFGFKDAFNLHENWFAQSYIAIDQGPMVIMIENYRSELCWNMFMSNPEIPQMIENIGFVGIDDRSEQIIDSYSLEQNYPNPFNSGTIIEFTLSNSEKVTLELFDVLGQKIKTLYDRQEMSAGKHRLQFDATELPSGLYFYRIDAGEFKKSKKMLLVR